MEENKLIQGDCLEIMKNLPKKSFDVILTDPPYMITDLHFDKKGFDKDKFLELSLDLLKDNGYFISFGSVELLGYFANTFSLRWTGVWVKSNPVMRTAIAKKPMSKTELYGVFAHPKHKIKDLTFNKLKIEGKEPYKKRQRYRGYRRDGKDSLSRASSSGWTKDNYLIENTGFRWQTDLIEAPNKCSMKIKERTSHPTQKPIKLLETLLKWCTNEGDLVLDPFAGSASTALACLANKRKYICIEKEEMYFKEAQERIEKEKVS